MRSVALVVGSLLLAACAVGERPIFAENGAGPIGADGRAAAGDGQGASSGPSTTASVAGAAAAETPPLSAAATASTLLPELGSLGSLPPVLLSPTGVLVPVLGRTPSGYRVLSPCGNETDLVYGQPVWEAEVVLDPGHGGDERGALGPDGQTEAELNLDVARRTGAVLEAQGISVALTRAADYRIPVRNRAAIADQLQASAFVSIHHNSPTPERSDKPGTEVYVQSGSAESARLGGLIYAQIMSALSVFDVSWAGRRDAGVLTVLNDEGTNAYGITRHPKAPVALAELAYISDPAEAVLLDTEEYRQVAAQALADGIVRYLTTTETGSGFVAKPRLFNPSGETGGANGCVDPPLS
jgi:N-acetylmuramoyl-L-alanine amidase